MPPITHLSVHPIRGRHGAGLKCQMFAHDLYGVDLFVGENGAGKTARLLSIVCAAVGIASTPTDTRRPYLETTPTDTGVTLTVAGTGVLGRELDASTRTKAHKQADADAARLLGRLPVSWDLADWARASRGERAKILDAIARAGGAIEAWDVARAQEEAKLAEGGKWPGLCVRALPSAEDGAEWLQASIVWTEDRLLHAGRAAQNASGNAKEARIEGARPGGEAEDKRRRGEMQGERADLLNATKDRDRALGAVTEHERRGKGLRADLQRLTREGKRLADAEPEPEAMANPALVQAVEDARARLEECPDVGCGPLTTAHLRAREDRDVARRNASDAGVLVSVYEKQRGEATCVHCGHADPLGIGPELEQARATMEECQQRFADADAADKQASEALEQAEAKQRDHVLAKRALEQAERAKAAEGPAARARATAWQAREARRKADLEAARERYGAMRQALGTWQASEPPSVPKEQDGGPRIQEIENELTALDARATARTEWNTLHRLSVNSARKAEMANKEHEECRAYLAHLREVRDRMAATAYAPIEAAARQLVQGRGALPVPYFRGPDSYGADCGHGEVPFHDLSKSQRTITAACLVYALTVVSNQPCRVVLLDDLENVLPTMRAPLLEALVDAHAADLLDNVIGCMALAGTEPDPEIDGVTVHRLERQVRINAVEDVTIIDDPAWPEEPAPIVSEPVDDDGDNPFVPCPF